MNKNQKYLLLKKIGAKKSQIYDRNSFNLKHKSRNVTSEPLKDIPWFMTFTRKESNLVPS